MDAIAEVMNNMVSVSSFNKGEAGNIFSSVKKTGVSKLVMRRNEPECVLVAPEEYSKLMAELEDLRDYKQAVERLAVYSGKKNRSFSEILAQEGLSYEDIGSTEDIEFE